MTAEAGKYPNYNIIERFGKNTYQMCSTDWEPGNLTVQHWCSKSLHYRLSSSMLWLYNELLIWFWDKTVLNWVFSWFVSPCATIPTVYWQYTVCGHFFWMYFSFKNIQSHNNIMSLFKDLLKVFFQLSTPEILVSTLHFLNRLTLHVLQWAWCDN